MRLLAQLGDRQDVGRAWPAEGRSAWWGACAYGWPYKRLRARLSGRLERRDDEPAAEEAVRRDPRADLRSSERLGLFVGVEVPSHASQFLIRTRLNGRGTGVCVFSLLLPLWRRSSLCSATPRRPRPHRTGSRRDVSMDTAPRWHTSASPAFFTTQSPWLGKAECSTGLLVWGLERRPITLTFWLASGGHGGSGTSAPRPGGTRR